ncbi:MAG: GntR family transcriptional regulator [Caldimonas sp.]
MPTDTHPVLARFSAGLSGLPKHARLRQAIIDAVQAGELPAGMKMVGERELSQSLGVSLGTTQKALGRLVDDGFLVRRQGHGTFVGTARRAVSGSWHYRFLAPDGTTELPVFTSVVERRLVDAEGPWSAALGPDEKGYVLLVRRLEIDGQFDCSSRMVLAASRFGRLLRMAEKRLADTNLKALLEREFAAPTLASDGVAHVVACTPADASLLAIAPGTAGLQVQIRGFSFGRTPITWQRMFVPPTAYGLRLDFNPPSTDAWA